MSSVEEDFLLIRPEDLKSETNPEGIDLSRANYTKMKGRHFIFDPETKKTVQQRRGAGRERHFYSIELDHPVKFLTRYSGFDNRESNPIVLDAYFPVEDP
jgi:hypothetical protein